MLTCRTCIKQKRLKRDILYSNKPSMALYLLIYECHGMSETKLRFLP